MFFFFDTRHCTFFLVLFFLSHAKCTCMTNTSICCMRNHARVHAPCLRDALFVCVCLWLFVFLARDGHCTFFLFLVLFFLSNVQVHVYDQHENMLPVPCRTCVSCVCDAPASVMHCFCVWHPSFIFVFGRHHLSLGGFASDGLGERSLDLLVDSVVNTDLRKHPLAFTWGIARMRERERARACVCETHANT